MHKIHGLHGSPEWKSWMNMRARCLNPKAINYERYGGRGITICERWKSFESFYADMGPKPSPRHTLERKDNMRGYEPGNCIWDTPENQVNNRRSNINITMNGKTQTLARWCRELGLNYKNILPRIRELGWDPVRAITQPERKLTPRKGQQCH